LPIFRRKRKRKRIYENKRKMDYKNKLICLL
jgi:hypothetical protein